MRILVLNAGSSSLKSSVIEQPGDRSIARGEVEASSGGAWTDALRVLLDGAADLDAVGHRVVHGGLRHTEPLRLDAASIAELGELRALAPLHNGPALEVIASVQAARPDLPQVACFDTAFHAGLPPAAYVYPLPYEWYSEWSVRRFGFHGLSVAWSVERAAALLDRPVEELSLVVAHLGSGCSVTAVSGGRSLDTSMGMTPLEGLMMGTRGGSVDPGILLELLTSGRLDLSAMTDALLHASGIAGVSGVSADLRAVEAAAVDGDHRSALAMEIFVRRAAAAIAASATALPGLDAVVFTGGIGEHATVVRDAICGRLAQLGLPSGLVPEPSTGDRILSPAGSRVAVLTVTAREDLVIAREVARLLA